MFECEFKSWKAVALRFMEVHNPNMTYEVVKEDKNKRYIK